MVWDRSADIPNLLSDGTNSYVCGPDGTPLEQISGSGDVTFLHHDQLGSTRLLTSTNGASVGAYSFDAYGSQVAKTGSVETPFGYAGQYLDSESGLVYMHARYYDPSAGVFISADPMGSFGSGQNLHAYVAGDPINYVDPSGLFLKGAWNSVTSNWGTWATYATMGACTFMSGGICIGVVAGVTALKLAYRLQGYTSGLVCGKAALEGAGYDVGYTILSAVPGLAGGKAIGTFEKAGNTVPMKRALEYFHFGQVGTLMDYGGGAVGHSLGIAPGLGET